LAQLKSNGMAVTELSPAEQAKLRAKLAPVTAKYGQDFGEAFQELNAELAKIRKK
jgi:TRAP-type C4-dicarboxylate transport system substrate-binding protein